MISVKARFIFPGDTASQPLTTNLVSVYGLEFNILQARIEPGRSGQLVAELTGDQESINKGLAYVSDKGITVQILSNTIVWDESSCVSCGSCTSVCASGALHLDAHDKLAFDHNKCIVCQMCIRCCPMKVLRLGYNENE
ncbi:MAG: NIL domain-containing protein [Christensenellales bacterium]|jgi:ferredoxin